MKQHFIPATIWVITSGFSEGHPIRRREPTINDIPLQKLYTSEVGRILYNAVVIPPCKMAIEMACTLTCESDVSVATSPRLMFHEGDPRALEWVQALFQARKFVTPIKDWERFAPGPFRALKGIAEDALHWIGVEYQAIAPSAQQVLAIVDPDIASMLCFMMGERKKMPFGPAEGFVLKWENGQYVVSSTFATFE